MDDIEGCNARNIEKEKGGNVAKLLPIDHLSFLWDDERAHKRYKSMGTKAEICGIQSKLIDISKGGLRLEIAAAEDGREGDIEEITIKRRDGSEICVQGMIVNKMPDGNYGVKFVECDETVTEFVDKLEREKVLELINIIL